MSSKKYRRDKRDDACAHCGAAFVTSRTVRKYCSRKCKEGHNYQRRSARQYWLRKTYNISVDEYENMLNAQGGGCAICKAKANDGDSLHVDHNHISGLVRSLLCQTCNMGLGLFRDSPELLRTAAVYLERSWKD